MPTNRKELSLQASCTIHGSPQDTAMKMASLRQALAQLGIFSLGWGAGASWESLYR
jgi:hypothetical protein